MRLWLTRHEAALLYSGSITAISTNLFPRCEIWMDVPIITLVGALGFAACFIALAVRPSTAIENGTARAHIIEHMTALFFLVSAVWFLSYTALHGIPCRAG